ncbi:MAG: domain S-box protein [Firmicutes bacterium]|nr:domain S-box protein [Bacillota bacterium]
MLRTILVDDEKPALKALERLLIQYPDIYIVGMFTDINQALELIKNDSIHLLFLDIDMPKLNGIAAAKEILSNNATIDIIFVTAYSHFAVEAFEVNAFDYIMKPVSPKRLNKTIERIIQNRLAPDVLSMQQNKNEFLNKLITKTLTDIDVILQQAKKMDIDFTQSFSLFILLFPDTITPDEKIVAINAFIEELSKKIGLVVWQTSHGIGILDYTLTSSENCKNEELTSAINLKTIAAKHFPDIRVALGIANRYPKLENFPDRYVQARNAAIIGFRVSPASGIYHFADSGFLPILNQYVNEQSINTLIDSTIGKLLEHDRVTGNDLFHTMEKIILSNNLQSVANMLFIHYKTVLFRKQAIEKILGVSMNSFAGRTMLGIALTLFYLKDIPPISKE